MDVGLGLARTPRISIAPDPDDDKMYVKTSKGLVITIDPPPRPGSGSSVIYWKQNQSVRSRDVWFASWVSACWRSAARVPTSPRRLQSRPSRSSNRTRQRHPRRARRAYRADPVVLAVQFEPSEPESRERLRAIVEVSGAWTSLHYEWTLNGVPIGQNSAQLVLPTISTGDVIGVRVIPFRGAESGTALDAQSFARNQRPSLRRLSIDRADPTDLAGAEAETWRAVARAEDPDADRLEFEYRWLVNGNQSEVEEEFFAVAPLKRGDKIEVRARVFDGQLWSPPVQSGEIVISDHALTIVSVPRRPDETGYFRYLVGVEDDGGKADLEFSLRKSPLGMRIDERKGEVTWRPSADQAGRHEVEVVVRSEAGSEASQAFSIALVSVNESDPGPAAAQSTVALRSKPFIRAVRAWRSATIARYAAPPHRPSRRLREPGWIISRSHDPTIGTSICAMVECTVKRLRLTATSSIASASSSRRP